MNKVLLTIALAALACLGAVSIAHAQPVISIEGSCPTRLTFRWEGASANYPAALIVAREIGECVLPSNRCGGTVMGLGCLRLRVVAFFRTGPEGRGEVSGRASRSLCGQFLQMLVVEGNPCTTSNVVQIPE